MALFLWIRILLLVPFVVYVQLYVYSTKTFVVQSRMKRAEEEKERRKDINHCTFKKVSSCTVVLVSDSKIWQISII